MSTETAVDPRIAKSNDALRTPMGEFWRKFKKQPVAMAAAGFVFFLIIVALVGPMITPFGPLNFFHPHLARLLLFVRFRRCCHRHDSRPDRRFL